MTSVKGWIFQNQLKTWLLIGMMTGLLVLIGGALGGIRGASAFLVIAIGLNLVTFWYSDRLALRMTRSVPLPEEKAPELYATVRELSRRAKIPMPRIYMTPSQQPNAFATGRSPEKGVLAVTEGIMSLLRKDELEGVLAHEISHIRNRDILVGAIAAAIAAAIMWMATMLRWGMMFGGRDQRNPVGLIGILAASILAPIAALLVQMAISRSREYNADATAAALMGNPEPLADALQKMDAASRTRALPVSPAVSHLFIVNPLTGKSFMALFSTHPPIPERVKKLRSLQGLGYGL